MASVTGGVFSSEPFLDALNETFFGGRARSGDVAVGDHVVRTLIHGDQPVLDASFLDFFVPMPGAAAQLRGRYAPRVATVTHPAAHRSSLDLLVVEPAPFVEWSAFPTWEDVQQHWKRNEKNIVRESRRRANRLQAARGPLRFTLEDARDDAFRTCIEWKAAQFRDSGLPDPFEDPREERLLRALWRDGLAVLSTLDAGDQLVAAHLGLVWEGTTHWWLPTYDRAFAPASPGRLLLEWVMQRSYERGDGVFDFLRGGSDYKWNYATAYREVREAGRPPLRRLAQLAKARAARRYPRLATAGRSTRDAVRPILARATTARERAA